MLRLLLAISILLLPLKSYSEYLLIEMDSDNQRSHLKAYGITYLAIEKKQKAYWLLNYKGGSFLIAHSEELKSECLLRGVSFKTLSDQEAQSLIEFTKSPSQNTDALELEKAPKIAVYSPKSNMPWDDAVTMALTYAQIPYDVIYDEEVVSDVLSIYDWLHLHHEDFTGQYGKFWAAYKNAPWYVKNKMDAEEEAKRLGFEKVSLLKLEVSEKIREFVVGGGFLFAMCSATETFDIALSAKGLDICEAMYDGDDSSPNYHNLLNFKQTFAFQNFNINTNPGDYEFSNIDTSNKRVINEDDDYFTLFEFSAKWDPVPTILTQNHKSVIKGFMGQTTAFDKNYIKSSVLILGETRQINEARYIHSNYGKGMWTFFGGHDPEDYRHRIGDPKTDLKRHPKSPGYRLILNNILLPSVKKKPQKT